MDEVQTSPPTRKTRSTNAAKKSASTESTNSGDSGINSPEVAQKRNSKRSKKEDRNDSAISKVSKKSKASISKPKEKTKAVNKVCFCVIFFSSSKIDRLIYNQIISEKIKRIHMASHPPEFRTEEKCSSSSHKVWCW